VTCDLSLGGSTTDPYVHVIWDNGASAIQGFGIDESGTAHCCFLTPSNGASKWYVFVLGSTRRDDIDFNYNGLYLRSPDTVIPVDAVAYGGDDNDVIRAGVSNVGPITWFLHGEGGADDLFGSPLVDKLYGSIGADQMYGYGGDDTLEGGPGEDEIDGGEGNDSMLGGPDDDILYCFDGDDEAFGNGGNDSIYGGAGDDKLHGNAGSDTIYGGTDDDWICAGDDVSGPFQYLYGESGDDWIWGIRNSAASTGGNTSIDCGGQTGDNFGPASGSAYMGFDAGCASNSLTWSAVSSFCAE